MSAAIATVVCYVYISWFAIHWANRWFEESTVIIFHGESDTENYRATGDNIFDGEIHADKIARSNSFSSSKLILIGQGLARKMDQMI